MARKRPHSLVGNPGRRRVEVKNRVSGATASAHPIVTLIEYGPDEQDYRETRFDSPEAARGFTPIYETLWLNVHGIADTALLAEVVTRFKLHTLTLEDILNTEQRPKVEAYDHYLFISTKLVSYQPQPGCVHTEQISLILGRGFVLTFQEKPSGTFDELRDSLRHSKGLIRRLGADYLVYALVDKLVDRHFGVLESLSEGIEKLEDEVTGEQPGEDVLKRIHALRRELLLLRRALWPVREVLNALQRDDADYFSQETQLYLRDVCICS